MTFKKWDIVLLPFPFSDQKRIKKRPGLILTPNEAIQNDFDILISFMTSNLKSPPRFGDYLIKDWQNSNLPKPTMIRMKFATIEYGIIIKRLGKLTQKDQYGFNLELKAFFKI